MTEISPSTTLRKGSLGAGSIAFFVISAAGPLVAMSGGIPVAMLFGNGPGLPAMFLLASIILLAFATGYTRMARDITNAGGFYAFAARSLGGTAAGATGMIALLSYNAIQIGLYGLFGAAAQSLIEPASGIDLPWYAYSAIAFASIACLGYRQVDLSAKILGLLVAAEYLVVLLLDGAILASGGADGISLRPFAPDVVAGGTPAVGLMLCFAAFIGFEATTIYSEEARDPQRTIPLATYFSLILIGGFYTLSTWAIVNGTGVEGLLPALHAMGDPTELLFSLSERYVGGGLPLTMRILFVTSTYASLLAFHNAIARYLFAMGRERLLPASLGETHPIHQSPHMGSLAQSGIAAICIALFAVAGVDPILVVFTLPSAVATLGIIVLMAITAVSIIRYLRSRAAGLVIALTSASLIAFIVIAGLATVRFDLLAGSADAGIRFLPLSIPVAGVLGYLLARRLKAVAPDSFARLGESS